MKRFFALALGAALAALTASVCFAAEPIKGDVTQNGLVEADDASYTLQYTLAGERFALDDVQKWAADVNGEEGINADDAANILQKALLSTFEFKNNTPYDNGEPKMKEYKKPDVEIEVTDTSDGTVVTTFSELKNALAKGGKIYVKGSIECSEQLKLSGSGADVIGLMNEDGTGACLDFAKLRDSRSQSGSGGTGIVISGTKYNFTNIIIQNAGDCGVRINAASGGDCVFTNCVFRYNNNSGLSVTGGGHDNTFINCDSYRNGDIVQKSGADADGFSVKLAAGKGNTFYNCRAWENSDDGWDSYDRGDVVPDVSYVECLAWHNGNPDVFTGEYDYNNYYPLDKNLIYVQAILAADPDFEAKYNAHEVEEWPKVTMRLLGTTNTYQNLYTSWGGNPNGFKFGSAASDNTEYRYIENCIAFDHYGNDCNPNKAVQWRAKGFDQNCGDDDTTATSGPKLIHYDMKNILAFNNVENIQMSRMTADSINGVVWSFDNCLPPEKDPQYALGGYPDQPSEGMTITEPENKDELREKVYAYREMIYGYVYNDVIPREQLCKVFPEDK
ncbi:MAG: right-handed parallel beta-helix repeat-containing protein [Firmicutes bacterium]|nr:right-handed parallel beta-helix repeat-containing protein [Bacillota bacterium]